MAVQENGESTVLNVVAIIPSNHLRSDPGKSLSSEGVQVQLKELSPSGDEHAPKARKPYTITKQREKWTEEEHARFLEALKLYGRAWRQIEDYIGTKTAVQIRSHAQKFFSKIVREGSNAESGEAIEIPPPRPKRKPMHPYPRKLVHSLSMKGTTTSEQLERSSSPLQSEQNRSPTSVLSAIGSETMWSATSNAANGYSSPVSSAAGSSPTGLVLAEQENGYPSSSEEENEPPSPVQAVPDSSQLDRPLMKVEEGSSVEVPKTCLKLFGTVVLVTDSHRPSSSVTRDKQSHKTSNDDHAESSHGNLETEVQKPEQTHEGSVVRRDFLVDTSRNVSSQWSAGVPPLFYSRQFPQEDLKSAEISSLPWWALCGNLPFPFVSSHIINSTQTPDSFMDASRVKELNKERSRTASNISLECVVEYREKTDDVDSKFGDTTDKEKEPVAFFRLKASKTSAFSKPNLESNTKGFVPYKRCVSERDSQQSQIEVEERDGQRIRLCL